MSLSVSECRAQTLVNSSIWSGPSEPWGKFGLDFCLCCCLHDFNPEHPDSTLQRRQFFRGGHLQRFRVSAEAKTRNSFLDYLLLSLWLKHLILVRSVRLPHLAPHCWNMACVWNNTVIVSDQVLCGWDRHTSLKWLHARRTIPTQ